MKVHVKNWQAVAIWRWDTAAQGEDGKIAPEDPDEEVCGICRLAFDSTCPECKIPGDDCPLIWGQCTHVFHMHCLLKWIDTESSKGQCPMDRREWVNAERAAAPSSPMAATSPVLAPQAAPFDREGSEGSVVLAPETPRETYTRERSIVP
ncbi:anaphase-promoting complex subunit 11 RING-H2 finger-domain-containing protein [Mrakia frigida]|uniref:anaphase-promoting complex subunit 11 n=1 Tax=Mrakia frigida TaxID=29902 RepID=UPI003FCC2115